MSSRLIPSNTGLAGSRDLTPSFDEPEPFRPEGESPLKSTLTLIDLAKRHWLIVAICVAVPVVLVAVWSRFEQRAYRAGAVIRLADKTRSLSGGLGSTTNDRLGTMVDPILSQVQILQSRRVAEEIVRIEGLQFEPITRGFSWRFVDSVSVAPSAQGDTIRARFSEQGVELTSSRGARASGAYGQMLSLGDVRVAFKAHPGMENAEFGLLSEAKAIQGLMVRLRGRPRERTDIVDVTVEAGDPVLAQRTVNSAVVAFQAVNARTARQESVRRRQFLETQLAKTEAMLSEVQVAHNRFRARERVYSSQDQFRAQQADFTALEIRRQELDADRKIYVSLLQTTTALPQDAKGTFDERLTTLISSPGIASNPVVAQLYAELINLVRTRDSLTIGPQARSTDNPDVTRITALITSTQNRVVSAVRGQIGALEARIDALDELRKTTSAQLTKLPDRQSEEAELTTKVTMYQRETDRLREQLQRAQIEEAAEAGQVEVVDLATVPTIPIGSGLRAKLIFALLIGLAGGLAAGYLAENYNVVIRRREDLDRALTAPNLAVVPRFASNGKGRRFFPGRKSVPAKVGETNGGTDHAASGLILLGDPRSLGAEAYRTLRTNLLFSAAVQSVKRLVVTSAAPEEGKSTTAANLAVAFAQQGHRVLLVDCDLRKPRLHELFAPTSGKGFSDVIAGDVTLEAAISETETPNLKVLHAGRMPPNPSELLGSTRMADLLKHAEESFDLILLDSPPVLVAADAAIMGRFTDGVILVVRAGKSSRSALQNAVQQLGVVGARVLGTVFNDPDGELSKQMDYHGYYYTQYTKARTS